MLSRSSNDPQLDSSSATFSATEELKEIELFFRGKDQVHDTLRRLVENLSKAKISYAVLGGMALAVHRYRRTTIDVDVLLTQEGFSKFRDLFLNKDYDLAPQRQRRFIDRANGVTVDILITGRFPGSGQPGPISFPDPADVGEAIENIQYVNLETQVELKLAARRYKDFGDVVELIRFNDLDESFSEKIHPSVRNDYIECLEEKLREDEYEAREG